MKKIFEFIKLRILVNKEIVYNFVTVPNEQHYNRHIY